MFKTYGQSNKIIFSSFRIVTTIMIFDHTEKEKYGNENLQLRGEGQSVATTNTDTECTTRQC